ncbi:MAG: hypothetical protein ACI9T9_002891 [Oleiphilaceae bacterium]|jgi:hypothetical protein
MFEMAYSVSNISNFRDIYTKSIWVREARRAEQYSVPNLNSKALLQKYNSTL